MEEVEIDWKMVVSIWWSMFWRLNCILFFFGFLLVLLLTVVFARFGYDASYVGSANSIALILISIPAGIWAIRKALEKTHGGCRVVLVKQVPEEQPAQP